MVRYFAALSVCLAVGCAPSIQQGGPVNVPPAAQAPVDAKALVQRMADALAGAGAFSMTMQSGYDVVQEDGQKVEFGDSRRIILRRPDGIRIDFERANGVREQGYYNGKDFVLFNPVENIYSKLQRPGTVDEFIAYVINDLQTPIPLSVLLLTSLRKEMDERITEIDPVNVVSVGGRVTDHIAARTDYVDFQVWIARGDVPVPLRVVITYKNAPGQPQFWANLSDWNFNPQTDPATFTFTPPPGAEAVPFMVPLAGTPDANRVRR